MERGIEMNNSTMNHSTKCATNREGFGWMGTSAADMDVAMRLACTCGAYEKTLPQNAGKEQTITIKRIGPMWFATSEDWPTIFISARSREGVILGLAAALKDMVSDLPASVLGAERKPEEP